MTCGSEGWCVTICLVSVSGERINFLELAAKTPEADTTLEINTLNRRAVMCYLTNGKSVNHKQTPQVTVTGSLAMSQPQADPTSYSEWLFGYDLKCSEGQQWLLEI